MEHSTPKKARLQGICDYLDGKRIPYSHNDVFQWVGVSKRTGWRLLSENRLLDARTFHYSRPETRGRKRKFTQDDIRQMEKTIEENGWEGRTIEWEALPAAAGLDIQAHRDTIRLAMKGAGFRRCLACLKHYVSPQLAEGRLEYARTMLERYPMPQDWRHVRFSDETHFGWGPEGRAHVIRRPWERDCADCVQERREPPEKDIKRVHAWAAVGYNFKSPLIWYDVPGNANGKMSLKVYRDSILEPVVGSWLREGHQFALEEDNDSGHGTGKSNIVRTWKKQNNLIHFFNHSHSPDIPPIEKAWQAPKEATKREPIFDDSRLKEVAEEGWESLSQEKINSWVDQIPDILDRIVEMDGKMTAF